MENFSHDSNIAERIRESMIEEIGLKRDHGYGSLARHTKLKALCNGLAAIVAGSMATPFYLMYDYAASAAKDGDLTSLEYGVIAFTACGMTWAAVVAGYLAVKGLKNYSFHRYWKSRETSGQPITQKDIRIVSSMNLNR
jgi:hypothetical protein